MSSVNLAANVRQNLLTLQDTSALQGITTQHLSTGKKVSSALDNPVNYFTAKNLDSRSSALSQLLDGMSNGVQVIQAANKGITSITSLVQQLQSVVKTARQDASATTLGAASTATTVTAALDSTKQLSFSLPDGSTVGIAVGSGTGGGAASLTKSQIATAINNNATLSQYVSANINEAGNLDLKSKTASAVTVAGLNAGTIDGSATTTSLTAGTTSGLSDVRKNSLSQFNDLLAQVDKIAKDSGYNGTNLLAGDALKVVFNEKTGADQSNYNVQAKKTDGTSFGALSYASLGLNQASTTADASANDFSVNTNLDNITDKLSKALLTLQTQSSQYGTSLAMVQTRQDFTKQIVDVLQTGSANLTDADMNEEAANSTALSTKQSLGISALSLANQANQGILQLLR